MAKKTLNPQGMPVPRGSYSQIVALARPELLVETNATAVVLESAVSDL